MSVYHRRLPQTVAIAGGGAAYAIVNTVVLVAPGANKRYRIFGVWARKAHSAAALPANVQYAFFSTFPTGAGVVFAVLGVSAGAAGGKLTDMIWFDDVGIPTSLNVAVQVQTINDLAAIGSSAGIIYAVEEAAA